MTLYYLDEGFCPYIDVAQSLGIPLQGAGGVVDLHMRHTQFIGPVIGHVYWLNRLTGAIYQKPAFNEDQFYKFHTLAMKQGSVTNGRQRVKIPLSLKKRPKMTSSTAPVQFVS